MGEEAPAGDVPLTEETACRPADAYGRSKLAAEELCRARSREIEVCVLRPPVVYGPGMRGNVARLIRAVDRRLPLPLGAATARRSMIFVTNLVDAVHACVTTDRAAGETFLVRDSEDLTVREMILRFARVLDRRALLLPLPIGSLELVGRVLGRVEDVRRLTRPFVISSARIERLLGWRPPVTVDRAFAETVTAFRARVPALSEA
jgi:UDP-glucose 4-epimerase